MNYVILRLVYFIYLCSKIIIEFQKSQYWCLKIPLSVQPEIDVSSSTTHGM